MDPYLLKLALTMMDKFNEYELLNGVMNKIQILAIQIMHNKEILSQKNLALLDEFITKHDTAKDAYFTAKRIYETELIEIAKEVAEAKNRTEASKHQHRTFLPLQNGTFGCYGLPTEQSFNPKWL
jgi:hypothetical protein